MEKTENDYRNKISIAGTRIIHKKTDSRMHSRGYQTVFVGTQSLSLYYRKKERPQDHYLKHLVISAEIDGEIERLLTRLHRRESSRMLHVQLLSMRPHPTHFFDGISGRMPHFSYLNCVQNSLPCPQTQVFLRVVGILRKLFER